MRRLILGLFLVVAAVSAAITTLDGVIAGMRPPEDFLKNGSTMEAAGIHHSLFYTSGRPGAAVAPSPGMSGAALTSYAGQIPFSNPGSGNTYLARFQATSSSAGTLLLVDRLWHNSGIVVTTTTTQAVDSATWPARDRDGSTNGEGVMVALEASTGTTNSGAIGTITMTYTDQSGNTGHTASISNFPATAQAGTLVPFALAAGDRGIRSIQEITLGTSLVTGTVHLVAYRIVGRVDITLANSGAAIDALTSGFPRLYDNTVPFLIWLPSSTSATGFSGQVVFTQG